jgi:putative phosphoribosyl transferase
MSIERENALFADRTDAGRLLGELVGQRRLSPTIVLALPRGGVAVGYEVARLLRAPLDVLVARKLGAPFQRELAVGAIAPGGVLVVDEPAIRYLGISDEEINRLVYAETVEMERRERMYRGEAPFPDLTGQTVLLVDDGLATGMTARAAILSVRQRAPRSIILAAPVSAPESADELAPLVDDCVFLSVPREFYAVGIWYKDFRQLTDDDVVDYLGRSREESPTAGMD